MCDPITLTIASTALAVASTGASTIAAVHQHQYEQKVALANRDLENQKVQDALKQGDIDSLNLARKQAQLAGAQRAAMAANGIDVGYGSALGLLSDTAMFNREDQMTLRENERRTIMGLDRNAANFQGQANAAKSAATGAIIGGVLSVGSSLAGGASKIGGIKAAQSAGGSGWAGA